MRRRMRDQIEVRDTAQPIPCNSSEKRLAALRKVERYDPVDGTWHEAAPLRAARTQPLVFRAKNMI